MKKKFMMASLIVMIAGNASAQTKKAPPPPPKPPKANVEKIKEVPPPPDAPPPPPPPPPPPAPLEFTKEEIAGLPQDYQDFLARNPLVGSVRWNEEAVWIVSKNGKDERYSLTEGGIKEAEAKYGKLPTPPPPPPTIKRKKTHS